MSNEEKRYYFDELMKQVSDWRAKKLALSDDPEDLAPCIPESVRLTLRILFPRGVK